MDELVRNFFKNIFSYEEIEVIYKNKPLSIPLIDDGATEQDILSSYIDAIYEELLSPQTKDLTADIRRAIGSKILEFLNRHHKIFRKVPNPNIIFTVLSKLNCISLVISDIQNKNIKEILNIDIYVIGLINFLN